MRWRGLRGRKACSRFHFDNSRLGRPVTVSRLKVFEVGLGFLDLADIGEHRDVLCRFAAMLVLDPAGET
jgi:hypothetical protein